GKQTTDFSGDLDEANAVALQGNRIVAAGYAAGDFALARYTPNGSLDPTFSGDGRQTTDFAGHQDAANAVAVRTDDRIVAAGSAVVAGRDFALARYTPNGALSPTFSGDGKQTTDFGGSDSAGGVALLPDGRIVAAGEGGPHLSTFALARYGAGGALDPSFSRDGTLVTSFGSSDRATGVAIQDDGKAVLVGGTGAGGFGLVRYRPDGSLDPTFSGDGRQTSFLYDGIDQANGVALSPNGKIVVVGGGGLGFVVARYNTDGSLDPKFSGDGRQTTYLNGAYGAAGVAIQGDGKIVAVGDAPPSGSGANSFGVVRYKRDGSLDPTFSGDGIQRTAFPSGGAASAVAIQTDGKIVVVGNAGGDFALVRYTPNGSLDPTFSGDGKQTTPAAFHQGAVGVALQDDGKIVVVGNDELVRYKPNGALDQTFSGDGRVDAGFRDNGLAIQPDGGIVIVGQAATGGGDFAVARYKPNGSLDRTFSGDGRQTTDFGGFDEANAVALQANGRIVAVGFGPGLTPTNDFAVARYLGG
ncbi:MAG TPA: delta-60 repeat domain-containing protein, partial [Planctomycetaceae bacterium]